MDWISMILIHAMGFISIDIWGGGFNVRLVELALILLLLLYTCSDPRFIVCQLFLPAAVAPNFILVIFFPHEILMIDVRHAFYQIHHSRFFFIFLPFALPLSPVSCLFFLFTTSSFVHPSILSFIQFSLFNGESQKLSVHAF